MFSFMINKKESFSFPLAEEYDKHNKFKQVTTVIHKYVCECET